MSGIVVKEGGALGVRGNALARSPCASCCGAGACPAYYRLEPCAGSCPGEVPHFVCVNARFNAPPNTLPVEPGQVLIYERRDPPFGEVRGTCFRVLADTSETPGQLPPNAVVLGNGPGQQPAVRLSAGCADPLCECPRYYSVVPCPSEQGTFPCVVVTADDLARVTNAGYRCFVGPFYPNACGRVGFDISPVILGEPGPDCRIAGIAPPPVFDPRLTTCCGCVSGCNANPTVVGYIDGGQFPWQKCGRPDKTLACCCAPDQPISGRLYHRTHFDCTNGEALPTIREVWATWIGTRGGTVEFSRRVRIVQPRAPVFDQTVTETQPGPGCDIRPYYEDTGIGCRDGPNEPSRYDCCTDEDFGCWGARRVVRARRQTPVQACQGVPPWLDLLEIVEEYENTIGPSPGRCKGDCGVSLLRQPGRSVIPSGGAPGVVSSGCSGCGGAGLLPTRRLA